MAKSLVIVESPAKAKTIGKYLGRGYTVKASVGHVLDLPKKSIGVDLDDGFAITLVPIPKKEKVIEDLRKAAGKADQVFLAADPDREGEAIAAHLRQVLLGDFSFPLEPAPKPAKSPKSKKSKKTKNSKAKKVAAKAPPKPPKLKPVMSAKKIYRVTMNEITKAGVKEAFEKPRQIDQDRVDAQQARRVLDRLVGYQVSPILWDKVKRGLSAGRVQTVALRLIIEREKEVRKFKQEEYWTIDANLTGAQPPTFDARLTQRGGAKLAVPNQEAADSHVAALEKAAFTVQAVQKKERKRNPVAPFITSTLQQDSSRKLRFSVKRTMMLAQRLYEGIELGEEGSVGLITYMRTDSTRVSDTAIAELRQYIPERFGPNYMPPEPRVYRTKKGAQDAHEAVRPTSVLHTPDSVRKYLKEDEFKVYQLIWQRFVASQMVPAVFDQTGIDITAGDYHLRATGSVLKFDGFLAVYDERSEVSDKEDDSREGTARLPEVNEGETLKLNSLDPEQHFTQPPPRFSEAALVKEMEQDGIGRPSTYANILSTLLDRQYVEKIKSKFYPTQLGELILDLLIESFDDIFDVAYTARMEEELDEIEEGKMRWTDALEEFYGKFAADLERADGSMLNYKAGQPTGDKCERCGKPLLLRMGRNGLFVACSGYPDCTNTREPVYERPFADIDEHKEGDPEICDNCNRVMVVKRGRFGQFWACSGYPDCQTAKPLHARGQPATPQPTGEKCPECESDLVRRIGRFGPFVACSAFPKCKYVKQNTIGIKCPECGEAELAERRGGKRGNVFYGCVRYPDCNYTINHKPRAEACPECKAPLTYEKRTKKGFFRYCREEKCDFQEDLPEPEEAVVSSISAD